MSSTTPTTGIPTGKPSGDGKRRIDPVDATVRWLDVRLGIAKNGRVFLDKIFPDHWSFLL
ncbi:MAG TPA: ubiquinol-cytochrome c reductase cytochrome b subunit, partial [Acidimicrobiaceae bacterium]|nr:ubiquinol-cytochrome c reductase cytochrome b subunit [Acidimicrobiaceae bacterium]